MSFRALDVVVPQEDAVNINTLNFFLIFQANAHFWRLLLGWAHVPAGSKAFWADRMVLQATANTADAATVATAAASAANCSNCSCNIRHKSGATCAWLCGVEEKHIVNGVEHVKQQTGRTTFVMAVLRKCGQNRIGFVALNLPDKRVISTLFLLWGNPLKLFRNLWFVWKITYGALIAEKFCQSYKMKVCQRQLSAFKA